MSVRSHLATMAVTGSLVTGAVIATNNPCKQDEKPLETIHALLDDQRQDLERQRDDLKVREIAVRNVTGKPAEVEQTIRTLQERGRDTDRQLNDARDQNAELRREINELKSRAPCPTPAPGKPSDTTPAGEDPGVRETTPSLMMAVLTDATTDGPYVFDSIPPLLRPTAEPDAVTPIPAMGPLMGAVSAGILWYAKRGRS